ncbi:prealbumin-like fold domain-containing protein [Methanolapillus africanus]
MISIFLSVILLAGVAAADPTPITNEAELSAIRSNLAGDYILTKDIEINSATWNSIGNYGNPFTGTFDGDGYSITFTKETTFTKTNSVSILDQRYDGYGLFGNVKSTSSNSGIIKDVHIIAQGNLTNFDGTNYKYYFGSLAGVGNGTATSGVTIFNCSFTAADSYNITGRKEVGGLVGVLNNGTMSDCYVSGNVRADQFVAGGLAGNVTNATISKCHATGTVSADIHIAGGLVGDFNGTISESYATGNVMSGLYAGGLVGNVSDGNILKSNASGSVTSPSGYAGGLVGYYFNGTVSECYATGDVDSTNINSDSLYAGGLIGQFFRGTILKSYASGDVNGDKHAGGLVGYIGAANVVQSYAIGNVNVQYGGGGLVGRSTVINVVQCYAAGNVDVSGDYGGGLVGDILGNGNITNSYAAGNVDIGGNYAGGLVGFISAGNITQCYATGNTDIGGDYGGGLVGSISAGNITQCYTTGNVDADGDYVGGIAGSYGKGNLIESYTVGDVSGNDSIGGLIGIYPDVAGNQLSVVNCSALNEKVTGTTNISRFIGFGDPAVLAKDSVYAWKKMIMTGTINTNFDVADVTSEEVWEQDPGTDGWSWFAAAGVWKPNDYSDPLSYDYRIPILSWQTAILEEDASHLRPKPAGGNNTTGGGGTGNATIPPNNTVVVQGFESSNSGAMLILDKIDSADPSKKLTATFEICDANGSSFNPKMVYTTNQSGHTEKIYLTHGTTYTIYETNAPNGYQAIDGGIKIVINEDMTIQPVSGYNLTQNGDVYTLTIPNTAESPCKVFPWWWLIALLFMLMIAESAFLYKKFKLQLHNKWWIIHLVLMALVVLSIVFFYLNYCQLNDWWVLVPVVLTLLIAPVVCAYNRYLMKINI